MNFAAKKSYKSVEGGESGITPGRHCFVGFFFGGVDEGLFPGGLLVEESALYCLLQEASRNFKPNKL